MCDFAMSQRKVEFRSFIRSNVCSLSISQFADKPTCASPYLAFLFGLVSDAPLFLLEVLTFAPCSPDLRAMSPQFGTHKHTRAKYFNTPRCTQTDRDTYTGREEQNKKCPKGPPRISKKGLFYRCWRQWPDPNYSS